VPVFVIVTVVSMHNLFPRFASLIHLVLPTLAIFSKMPFTIRVLRLRSSSILTPSLLFLSSSMGPSGHALSTLSTILPSTPSTNVAVSSPLYWNSAQTAVPELLKDVPQLLLNNAIALQKKKYVELKDGPNMKKRRADRRKALGHTRQLGCPRISRQRNPSRSRWLRVAHGSFPVWG